MDTAQEVDDGGTGCGGAGGTATEDGVGQQDSETRAGVRFQEEQDGFAGFEGLLGCERGENTVVDGVTILSMVP